jgi:hypothetical protein
MFVLANAPLILLADMEDGKSASTILLNSGVPAEPLAGLAKTVLPVWLARLTAKVPEVVTGVPLTDNIDGTVIATDVTVPPPPADAGCAHSNAPLAVFHRKISLLAGGVLGITKL